MPDLPNRDELEAQYAKLMAKMLKAYGGRLLEKLGDPPDLANLDEEFWDEEAKALVDALVPFGTKVYLEAAKRLLEETPFGVDWGLINQRAVEWASTYTFDLVKGINETTMETLQNAIGAFFEEGLTRGELEEMLSGLFGPVRAEMIAVTETTRAASEGEQELARQLAEQGIDMIPIWQTSNDELVCVLCGPRNEKPKSEWDTDGFPPLHPRCRCGISYELPKVEQ